MAVGFVITVIVLAAFGSLNGASVLFLIVLAAILVPPWETVPRIGRYIRTGAVIAIAFTYPFFWDNLFTIPIFGQFPSVPTGVVMLVFIMMAVGLNIVVGYAGLLDLGYVAFYAMGAYVAAWFASVQFAGQRCPKPGFGINDCPVAVVPKHNFTFGAVGVVPGTGGYHVSVWILLLLAGVITAFFGIVIGLPTLR